MFAGGPELGDNSRDNGDEDDFDAEAAGEDGMGVPDVRGWEDDDSGEPKEQVGWLEDDDIEDWESS